MAKRKELQFNQYGLPLSGFKWKPSTPRTAESLTFEQLKAWAALKTKIKHGPKLSRQQRVEYVRKQARKAELRKKD
jgi:hypothetical protein